MSHLGSKCHWLRSKEATVFNSELIIFNEGVCLDDFYVHFECASFGTKKVTGSNITKTV